jgi:hypothetical protein
MPAEINVRQNVASALAGDAMRDALSRSVARRRHRHRIRALLPDPQSGDPAPAALEQVSWAV